MKRVTKVTTCTKYEEMRHSITYRNKSLYTNDFY